MCWRGSIPTWLRVGRTKRSSGAGGGSFHDRLGTSAETWQARLQKLTEGRLLGRFFAASLERLREVAERLSLRRVANLGGCTAT